LDKTFIKHLNLKSVVKRTYVKIKPKFDKKKEVRR